MRYCIHTWEWRNAYESTQPRNMLYMEVCGRKIEFLMCIVRATLGWWCQLISVYDLLVCVFMCCLCWYCCVTSGKVLQNFDYSSGDVAEKEFTTAATSPSGQNVVLGSFNRYVPCCAWGKTECGKKNSWIIVEWHWRTCTSWNTWHASSLVSNYISKSKVGYQHSVCLFTYTVLYIRFTNSQCL